MNDTSNSFNEDSDISFELLANRLCIQTWNDAVASENPFYYVGGFVLGAFFYGANYTSFSIRTLSDVPQYVEGWVERMRYVAEAITNKAKLQQLIEEARKHKIKTSTAIVHITADDFMEAYEVQVGEGLAWTQDVHIKAVTYFLLICLLIWKEHESQAIALNEFMGR